MSQNKSPEGHVNSGFVFGINQSETVARVFELQDSGFQEFDVACEGLHMIVGDPVRCSHWSDEEDREHVDLVLEPLSWHTFDPNHSQIAVS